MNVGAISGAAPTGTSDAAAKAAEAKKVGLAFEQVLVNQLTQELAKTASSSDDQSSGDGASGLMGSDPASSAYAQMIPSVLSSSIMSSGGTGIAQQIAQSIDPALQTNPSLGGNPSLDPSLNLSSALGVEPSLGASL